MLESLFNTVADLNFEELLFYRTPPVTAFSRLKCNQNNSLINCLSLKSMRYPNWPKF